MEKNTAVLIVIGDEILRGQVEDKNTSYLASKLYAIGIKFHKVIIIPDSVRIFLFSFFWGSLNI